MNQPMNTIETSKLESLRRERAMLITSIQRVINSGNDNPSGTLIASYGEQLALVTNEINDLQN